MTKLLSIALFSALLLTACQKVEPQAGDPGKPPGKNPGKPNFNMVGGNGDPYNGPHLAGVSIPILNDPTLWSHDMSHAAVVCGRREIKHILAQILGEYTMSDRPNSPIGYIKGLLETEGPPAELLFAEFSGIVVTPDRKFYLVDAKVRGGVSTRYINPPSESFTVEFALQDVANKAPRLNLISSISGIVFDWERGHYDTEKKRFIKDNITNLRNYYQRTPNELAPLLQVIDRKETSFFVADDGFARCMEVCVYRGRDCE